MSDIQATDWKLTWSDIVSLLILTALTSIPILGWFFGLKGGSELMAVAIRRRRLMVFLASLASALPVTAVLTQAAIALGLLGFSSDGMLVFVLFAATPVALWLIVGSGAAVEFYRTRRSQMEASR